MNPEVFGDNPERETEYAVRFNNDSDIDIYIGLSKSELQGLVAAGHRELGGEW